MVGPDELKDLFQAAGCCDAVQSLPAACGQQKAALTA